MAEAHKPETTSSHDLAARGIIGSHAAGHDNMTSGAGLQNSATVLGDGVGPAVGMISGSVDKGVEYFSDFWSLINNSAALGDDSLNQSIAALGNRYGIAGAEALSQHVQGSISGVQEIAPPNISKVAGHVPSIMGGGPSHE